VLLAAMLLSFGVVGPLHAATQTPLPPTGLQPAATPQRAPGGAAPSTPADELAAALKWPKPFSLAAGERALFGMPVTRPGTIGIEIAWTGAAPQVALVAPNGQPVALTLLSQAGVSPLRLTYAVASAQLSAGIAWFVSVTAPGAPGSVGTISATYPPVDPATLQAAIAAARQRVPVQPVTHASAPTTAASPVAPVSEPARLQRVAAMESALVPRFNAIVQQVAAERSAQVNSLAISMRGRAGLASGPLASAADIRAILTAPGVVDVAPNHGFTGDRVVISTVNMRPDAASHRATFVVFNTASNQSVSLPAPISSATQAGPNVQFAVVVPPLPANFQQVDRAYVQIDGLNPIYTAVGPDFVWTNVPIGAAASLDPTVAAPGDWINITGSNFAAGKTSVRFSLPGNPDAPAAGMTYVSPTLVKAQVPLYSAKVQMGAALWVRTTAPNWTTIDDARKAFLVKPTVPVISGLDRTTMIPQEPLLVQGVGFAPYAQVVFRPRGGGSGHTYTATAKSASDTAILVTVPNIPLGPAAGVEMEVVVRNPSVEDSNAFPVHVNPIMDTVAVSDCSKYLNTRYGKKGADGQYFDAWGYAHCWDLNSPKFHGYMMAKGNSGFFSGIKDDDCYQLRMSLKNGWRFKNAALHVENNLFDQRVNGDPFDANIWGVWTTTPPMLGKDACPPPVVPGETVVQVHYWAVPIYNVFNYWLTFYIEGPRGFPAE
jgi:hypothetical protein